jgi:hypothetical protein
MHASASEGANFGFVIGPNPAYDVWLDNVMQQPIYEP